MIAGKTCTGCRLHQPAESYPLDRRHTDHRASRCRACERLRGRLYYRARTRGALTPTLPEDPQ